MRTIQWRQWCWLGLLVSTSVYADAFDELTTAIREFDDAAAGEAQTALTDAATRQQDSYEAQWQAAEACRLMGAQLRDTRMLGRPEKGTEKSLMEEQLALAKQGVPFAERATTLAETDTETANAHRVLGELYSLHISGMISGMRNGPKARSNIRLALDLVPNDPESLRAIGLMYLHNPPISGGDVPKAIETFTQCLKHDATSDVYALLLAMAYEKSGDEENAAAWSSKALDLNPENRHVELFRKQLN